MIEVKVNNDISAKNILLIDDDGNNLGLMNLDKALDIAESKSLDLVEISSTDKHSVCKILNYSKYRYSLQKKEKENKKNQKVQQLKEIKLRPKIDVHDFNVKLDSVRKFLKEHDKVKVSVFFKGREVDYMKDTGEKLITSIINSCKEDKLIKNTTDMKLEGKYLTVVINPS